ncbi:MAG: ribosome-associated translation inhibitor RaiA [Nanoarchaeota archaeon]|nr:ribosome-associated translation inhibitor RaiA [Nanoarchaeota archaeon]
MNTNIKTTNLTLTPAITDYTNKRLSKIMKILRNDPSARCDVELGKTTDHHQKGDIFRAEMHVVGKNLNAYASSEEKDLYTAIDSVREEILQELRTEKGKKISLIRRSGIRVKDMLKGLWPWRKNIS